MMNIPMRYRTIIRHAASTVITAITLAIVVGVPSVSAMPSATAGVFAHPPVTGDCASCHPKPATNPKRSH